MGWLTDAWSLFGAATTVIDEGTNRVGFRYGESYDLVAGTAYSFGEKLSAWVLYDAIIREKDALSAIDLDDSGGTWWYVEVGAAVLPAAGLAFDGSVDFLVYRNVNGTQPVVDLVASFGVRYSF